VDPGLVVDRPLSTGEHPTAVQAEVRRIGKVDSISLQCRQKGFVNARGWRIDAGAWPPVERQTQKG